MAITDTSPAGAQQAGSDEPTKVALLNNPTFRAYAFQILLALIVIYLVAQGIFNMQDNLQAAGVASGFGFLNNAAGFSVSQSLIEYDQGTSTYGRVFLVGVLNTLVVAF
ncbi:MAG: hypothetical protein AAFO77_14915, partial [Pseudomonadota bacterium]